MVTNRKVTKSYLLTLTLRVLKPIWAIFGLIANQIASFSTWPSGRLLLALEKVAIKLLQWSSKTLQPSYLLASLFNSLRVLKPFWAIFGLTANQIASVTSHNCWLAFEIVTIKSLVSSADHRWHWWSIQPIILLQFA